MFTTNAEYDVVDTFFNSMREIKTDTISTGEVGFITASIKSIEDVKVGDTITLVSDNLEEPLPGYKPMKPMVYCGIYPIDSVKYPILKEALEKLKLNDSSLSSLR